MKANITRIGNSRGIRIPAKLLTECGIQDTVTLTIKGKSIIISPVTSTRKGWDESAVTLMRTQSETLHIPDDIISDEEQ